MKRFVYKVTTTGSSKYGGKYQYADIYIVRRGNLEHIGTTRKWRTSGYIGEYGEVNAFLLANKVIPKTWSKDFDGNFTNYYHINEKYEIKGI